jgi:hypothetical protein
MDFRDPNSVGTFVYHCHLLEHEDGGMMGTIRVEPKETTKSQHNHGVAPTPSAKISAANAHSAPRVQITHNALCSLPKRTAD